MTINILAYDESHRANVIMLSLRCWKPVFAKLKAAVPAFVYNAFYPDGWAARQSADIAAILDSEADHVLVAVDGDTVAGWIGIRLHPEDHMGEIHILAVDPNRQREGIASGLMRSAYAAMREAGMAIVMVETGDDPGHAASRAIYESQGFERWPVARYFKPL